MKDEGEHRRAARPEERRLLALLRSRLDEARESGAPTLKLEPEDVERLCSGAGAQEDPAATFRALVRANFVRLRGRWREGRSAVRAPVYVERLVEGSDGPRGARRGPPSGMERNKAVGDRQEGEGT